MRSAYQVDIQVFQEIRDDIWAKDEADSSLIFIPSLNAFLRIGPQKIAKQALIWDFYRSYNFEDLLEILKLRTQTSVHTENLFVN